MKSFAAISTILAAASTASAQFGDTHVLKLAPLSVKTLTESRTARIDFTVQDLTGGAYTTCSTAWTIGALESTTWFPCTDSAFSFNFPTGISDVEDFNFLIAHSAPEPVGSVIARAILNSHAGTPVYICKTPGATPGTETECNIVEGSDVVAQPVNQ
ncbi:hypothetical protein BDV06DRAFT_227727 [Aspergillus oleicola]